MERNQVATSSGIGWRIAAELGGDIKRNTHSTNKGLARHINFTVFHVEYLNLAMIQILGNNATIKYKRAKKYKFTMHTIASITVAEPGHIVSKYA